MFDVESNITDLEEQLTKIGAAAADLSDTWNDVGNWWAARQRMIFLTQNRGQWQTRDPQTNSMGRGVLIRTGRLMRAVSSAKPLYASPSTARFGANSGGDTYYGLFHQRGAGVPKRQPVPPLTAQEGNEVVQIIAKNILGAS